MNDKWQKFCWMWKCIGHARYPQLMARAVEEQPLIEKIREELYLRIREAAAETEMMREVLAMEAKGMPELVSKNMVMRWFHGYKISQPQLPMKAVARLLEITRENAQAWADDPPEGEDLYSIEPLPLVETARLRTWGDTPKTYTHMAYFSNLGLQPHYWCLEDRDWICL